VKQRFLPCFCVRDSSGKPATGVACEDLQRIARPERSEGHAYKKPKLTEQYSLSNISYGFQGFFWIVVNVQKFKVLQKYFLLLYT